MAKHDFTANLKRK